MITVLTINHNLDHGLSLIDTRFVMVLDGDAHLQRFGWDVDLITF
jgi:hypothetical protein